MIPPGWRIRWPNPVVLSADEPRPRPWRPDHTDVMLAAATGLVSLADALWDSPLSGRLTDHRWYSAVLGILGALSLLLRRRLPYTVALVSVTLNVFIYVPAQVLLALYSAGMYGRSRLRLVAVTALAFALTGFVDGTLGYVYGSARALIYSLVFVVSAALVGYQGRRYVQGVVDLTAQLKEEQQLLTERARLQERARIATELHDSVAHRVSMIVIGASAMEVAERRDRAWYSAVAGRVRASGSAALRELREIIGMLQFAGDEAGLAPPPGLPELQEITETYRNLGVPTELRIGGTARPMPPPTAYTAVRILRASLENVVRHARSAATTIDLDFLAEELRIEITNAAPDRPDTVKPGGTATLLNLGERICLLGGSFSARPSHGGFRVVALLPLPSKDPDD